MKREKYNALPPHHADRYKKKKTYSAVRRLFFLIALLVTLTIAAFLYIQATLNKIGRISDNTPWISASDETFEKDTSAEDTLKASEVDLNLDDIELMKSDDVKNILLIGQDQRSGETARARSDSMIVCSINMKTHKIILSSLMRDLYVSIPGYSDNKINAAYAFGGMELLNQTIQNNFGIHIDGNVEVNLDGFIDALTKVGDLDIELTEEEADYINSHNYYGTSDDQWQFDQDWTLHEGLNTMTPSQVLAYSRVRYIGNSDWDRTKRQRKVVTTAFRKVMKSGSLPEIISLANHIFPCISTDMNNGEMLSIIKTIVTEKLDALEDHQIPVDGTWESEIIEGMDVLLPDLSANSMRLQQYIYGDGSAAGAANAAALEAS